MARDRQRTDRNEGDPTASSIFFGAGGEVVSAGGWVTSTEQRLDSDLVDGDETDAGTATGELYDGPIS